MDYVVSGIGAAVVAVGLDADFVRVIEDVIDTLIVKNVLNITDLPEQAQAKLLARKSFRERVSKRSLRLFEPTDFAFGWRLGVGKLGTATGPFATAVTF